MRKQKNYAYTIILNESMSPRMIADCMTIQGTFARRLRRVTDQNRDDHVYGATYQVRGDEEPDRATDPLSWGQMFHHYYTKAQAAKEGSPQKAAYQEICRVLSLVWVGNMGLLDSFMKEYAATLDEFQAELTWNGPFAPEPEEAA